MDSISQLALGAALGELTLGRLLGRRALLVGAVLGTLPDLNVLVRYSDASVNFRSVYGIGGVRREPLLSRSTMPARLLRRFPISDFR